MGAPGDAERYAAILRSALGLLEAAEEPGTVLELEEFYQLPSPA